MRLPRQSTAILSVAAVTLASIGGFGLAQYSEGGAFSFYRQQQPVSHEFVSSQATPSGWTYPVDSIPASRPAEPTKIDAIFASAVETPAPQALDYPELPKVPDTPEPADDAPLVQVTRGSWTQPLVAEPQPPGDDREQPSEASPPVETAAADAPES